MPKQNLTDEQAKLLNGLMDCVKLHNQLVAKITATGLTVDTLAYSGGEIAVEVTKVVRPIEVKFGFGHHE